MYKINEVSSIAGLSTHTLRYYEKEGILPPINRDHTGNRLYTEENIAWLDIVTCLKETNMPVQQIKEIVRLSIIGTTTIEERKRILLSHRIKIENQIKELELNINKVDRKIAFYEGKDEC
ncbi:MerR family transcriptional regulator [Cytobacillus spongiae]|uniref:MerR family transcriptional regulator n=1 Tax=Cytobacillus spongiae TaxID=2901381 RepID=UPI001F2F2E58|nr:MerR family transcriptional regulator [Cytobacillus spongiae]UII57132.1 MerR family transcriptional regulator [Cytobacillus spongiae]